MSEMRTAGIPQCALSSNLLCRVTSLLSLGPLKHKFAINNSLGLGFPQCSHLANHHVSARKYIATAPLNARATYHGSARQFLSIHVVVSRKQTC